MSKWVLLVLLTLSVFVPTAFSSDDEITRDRPYVDSTIIIGSIKEKPLTR